MNLGISKRSADQSTNVKNKTLENHYQVAKDQLSIDKYQLSIAKYQLLTMEYLWVSEYIRSLSLQDPIGL